MCNPGSLHSRLDCFQLRIGKLAFRNFTILDRGSKGASCFPHVGRFIRGRICIARLLTMEDSLSKIYLLNPLHAPDRKRKYMRQPAWEGYRFPRPFTIRAMPITIDGSIP
jgi:hypothetical protein